MAKNISNKTKQYFIEWTKCKNSFDYFCPRYIKIEIPGEDVLLKPYSEQSDFIKKIIDDHFVLSLKSRQIGISTIVQAYTTWITTFYKNVVIGIISKDAPEATDFSRTICGMIDKLPPWMRPKFKKRAERSFILDNGSKCYASPVAPNAPEKTLRGKGITVLIIDEAAFIKYIDTAWTAIVPALSTNQKHARMNNIPYGTIILSTPNKTMGVGKWFYQKYCDSNESINMFTCKTIYWRNIPELANDPEWYETTCKLLDNNKKKIDQELELKFIPTEGSFFESDIAMKLQETKNDPIKILKIFNGEIWIFKEPENNRYYISGVDTAPEFGSDKSGIEVFDYETLEQVWEFRGKCKVEDFIKILKLAVFQYPGLIVIENNSYGNQVIEAMNTAEYSTQIYKEKRKSTPGKGKAATIKHIPGLSTNSKTRPLMIDALYSYVTEYPECIKSERLKLELIGLVSKENGRVEADTGGHDDLALSSAFCYYVRKYDPPKMIDIQGKADLNNEISNIVKLNDIIPATFNSSELKQHIKKNIIQNPDESFNGIVDIFELIRG